MQIENTYTPTWLEQLLGKNYTWWYYLSYNIIVAQASLYATVAGQIANFTNSFITTYIWFLNNSTKEIITYLVLGSLYRSITQTFWNERISGEIVSGKITNLLIVPEGYIKYHFMANLGQRIFRNFSLVMTSLVVILIFINSIEFNINWSLLYLFILLPISFSLNYFLNVAVGFSAFFLNDMRDYRSTSNSIFTVLAILTGAYIPLDQLPYNLLSFVQFLPTAWLLHHPMQIYLGKYSNLEIGYTFLGGLGWCLALYFLAKLVFKIGLKKNESVGL